MKRKLLLAFSCIMIAGALYTQAQQIWAVASMGGTYNVGTIIRMNPDGSGFNVEFSYACSPNSGCNPKGNLMQASNGQLYGTCLNGGLWGSCTVDRYDPSTGTYYDIYDFNVADGDYPMSGLVEVNNGKLYGVAYGGGMYGAGVLYSIDLATNAYTVEFSFSAADGSAPLGAPILKNGILYGLTTGGGMFNYGVLYGFNTATHVYTALHQFSEVDGSEPKGSMYEASNGLLYGMTSQGGANGYGVIFSYDAGTDAFALLHSFNDTYGGGPEGSLMQAADGKLYGVTIYGGANGFGVLFNYDITLNTFTSLYDFVAATGSRPTGNLYQSSNYVLYGTAQYGGVSNLGVLFSYDLASNTYTDILDFNGTNGSNPGGGFVMVQMPTDVSQIEKNVFSVYPNPANEEININFAKGLHCSVTLHNVTGETLYASQNYSSQVKIDMSRLPKGIYFVEVKEDDGQITTQKIVKM